MLVMIVGAAVVIGASLLMGSSEALMTGGSKNPKNLFTAGTMSLTNSKSGTTVINASGLLPGGSANGTLTLTAQGTYSLNVTVSNAGIANVPASPALAAALTLTVEDVTTTAQTLWTGTMSSFTSLSLGRLTPPAGRSYRFTVAFPAGNATSGLQNASTTMTLTFTGVPQ
jgi:VCBS repeat-containing protein